MGENKDNKVKKMLLFAIPMSICNLRCHYCYLSQRDVSFEGVMPKMQYSPEDVRRALSRSRLGGTCFGNFCADGETLLTKDIDLYVKVFCEEGHYAEVVTNLTVTPMLDRFLAWDKYLLKRLEFKCSFHYLELKKRGLLTRFADNVQKIWDAGASANIEITPSDELIPYIDEVREFSVRHFGALPHLTIARNDATEKIEYLTKLPLDAYRRTWSQFNSEFWQYKSSIFGVKQKGFCYAGAWSAYVNLCTGMARQCYVGKSLGNVFAHPVEPFPSNPIGQCPIAHCYNGHAFLSLGLIPKENNDVRYGNLRDREKKDGGHWLQPELKAFFNSKLVESNSEYHAWRLLRVKMDSFCEQCTSSPIRACRKLKHMLNK